MAQTARISSKSDSIIKEISTLTGMTKVEIIESALEVYRHFERMRLLNESYTNLRANPQDWEEELSDREDLDGTMGDGFDEDS